MSVIIISFYAVTYCLNNVTTDNGHKIELTNYVLIDHLVGVENISEGYNLSLQVRIVQKMKYVMNNNFSNLAMEDHTIKTWLHVALDCRRYSYTHPLSCTCVIAI